MKYGFGFSISTHNVNIQKPDPSQMFADIFNNKPTICQPNASPDASPSIIFFKYSCPKTSRRDLFARIENKWLIVAVIMSWAEIHPFLQSLSNSGNYSECKVIANVEFVADTSDYASDFFFGF